jgi:hypothetical protein
MAKKTVDFSYSNIVEVGSQEALIAAKDQSDRIRWFVGDLVNTITKYHAEAETGIEWKDVCKAVAVFLGERSQDVQIMSMVALNITPKIRDEHPALSWGYFKRALQFGDYWQKVIEWAEAQTDSLNRPASLDAVYVLVGNPTGEAEPKEVSVEAAKLGTKRKVKKALEYVANRIKSRALETLDPDRVILAIDKIADILGVNEETQ